jgi:CHAT domain-containing protein/tetratricopeptide (TPR) repeat protein
MTHLDVLIVALGVAGWSCWRPRDPPSGSRPALTPPAVAIQPSRPLPAAQTDHDSLIARGESAYLRGEFDGARALWRDALQQARAANDVARQGQLLTWLGLAAYRKGDYVQARSLGEAALALKLRAGLTPDLSRSYNALGLLAWNEGRLSDATALFGNAAGTARASGDAAGLAKATNNLALVHTELGDFPEARQGFLETRRVGRRLGDARIEGGALTNLGMLDVQLGDPRSAIVSLREARALYRSIGYETGEQNALGQLGTAYDALGEPHLAFAALDSALELSRKEGLRQEEASNLELIAGLHRQGGDLPRALELYDRANRLNRALGLAVEEGTDLRSEAEIHSVLGRQDLAREFAGRALQIHQAAGARLQQLRDHLLLADLASATGDKSGVAAHLQAAAGLADALDARTARAEVALTKAAIADRDGDGRGVLRALRAARRELARGNYGTEWQAAVLRTRAYARLSLLDSAANAGREAVAAVERVRGNFGSEFLRTSYGGDKSAAYADLVDVLLRLGLTGEAFEIADAGRSRALLEHLGAPAVEVSLPGATIRGFAESEAVLRRIDTLVSRLDALEETPPRERDAVARARARALAAELTAARGDYETRLVQVAEGDAAGAALLGGRRISVGEVQRALQPGEALLEYFVIPERVILFVVTPEGVRSVARSIPLDDLARRVRLARDLLGTPAPRSQNGRQVLTALYEILVAPAERAEALRGARRLVIIPHSVLAYLPFAALLRETTGRYLMEDYALLQLPSAAVLPVLRHGSGGVTEGSWPTGAAAAFAPFPRDLPGSAREAVAFQRVVPGAETHEGATATEGHLREALAGGGIVHVATHGIMNLRNPMFSRIELAPSTRRAEDDGRLEVHELLDLRIHAPLVFLSGCETGLGAAWSTQFARGEDYATLAQAFLYAGVGSVVATLWRIGDDGAAAFTEKFYTQLRRLEPAEALAAAQRDMLRDSSYAAPYYWAGYQLSGGVVPLDLHSRGALSVQRK